MQHFLRELVEGAPQRDETIHFVTAREMVNIVLAACDGREGNPGDYREYRLKRNVATSSSAAENKSSQALVRG
jgi:hypothetical protein